MSGWTSAKRAAQADKTRATYARRRIMARTGRADVNTMTGIIRQYIIDAARLLYEQIQTLEKDEELLTSLFIAAMALDVPWSELPYDEYKAMAIDAEEL